MKAQISREEAIAALMEEKTGETTEERLDRIERLLTAIASAIVVSQKDAATIAGVSDDTLRNMALRGEVEPLQADGSRLNFLTLKQTAELKPRRKRTRKSK